MAETTPNTFPTKFDSPDSSLVGGATYDPVTKTLEVMLKGGLYRYEHVPTKIWEEFVRAESKGAFFQASIRPHFTGTKQ